MRHELRSFFLVAALFPLCMAGTWFWGRQLLDTETSDVQARVEQAEQLIESDFADLRVNLVELGQSLGSRNDVLRCLREATAGNHFDELPTGQKAVIRIFNRLDIPDYMAIELYDVSYQLLGWRGFILPVPSSLVSREFPDEPVIQTVEDGGIVKALAYWHPVRQGTTVIGAVRILHLVGVPRPEPGLQAYDLATRWSEMAALPIGVSWGVTDSTRSVELELTGVGGHVLGGARIQPFTDADINADALNQIENIQAFWLVLLVLWVLGGGFLFYFGNVRLVDSRPGHTRFRFVGFVVVAVAWITLRYVLHWLEIPGRWLESEEVARNLFRAGDLGSEIGGGLFRSVGEYFLTGLFALLLSVGWLWVVAPRRRESLDTGSFKAAEWKAVFGWIAVSVLSCSFAWINGYLTHRVVEDSTLEYLRWSGLLPEFPVLAVYSGLLLVTLAFLFFAIGPVWLIVRYSADLVRRRPGLRWIILGCVLTTLFVFSAAVWPYYLSTTGALLFVLTTFAGARYGRSREVKDLRIWSMRGLFLVLMTGTVLLYPVFYEVSHEKGKEEMVNVAEDFVYRKDEDVLFAIRRILDHSQERSPVDVGSGTVQIDSVALRLGVTSLLNELNALELGNFEVSAVFVNSTDRSSTGIRRGGPPGLRTSMSQQSADEYVRLVEDFAAQDAAILVRPVVNQGMQTRFLYEGITLLEEEGKVLGWFVVRAEQRFGDSEELVFFSSETGSSWHQRLSIAEYQEGTLVRSQGQNFGRTRLPEAVDARLKTEEAFWVEETVYDTDYYTYYRRLVDFEGNQRVVGVRAQAVVPYDHLYYILRIAVSGLWLCIPFYLAGLWFRRRMGVLPAPRVEFRDKVLNGFLAVGIISVAAMGLIGEQVLNRGDEEAVQSRLDRRLERFQEAISLDLPDGVLPYTVIKNVLSKNQLDSLARVLSLELNIYEGPRLRATSRPEYTERRWIEMRMPIQVYERIYLENYRTVYLAVEETVSLFPYTIGYRAFPDEQGYPRYVVAVLTTPEQQRIREESARTAAYLFGSLLVLLFIFMGTATFLSSALARPMLKLRDGLRAVAAGRFDQQLPVQTRDEVGELVETFNEMQQQLADSRTRLSQQERQLAWNEMARQVAHEIKNPLTPMRLSVQHLQRAYSRIDTDNQEEREQFSALFKRITSTLSEQISALARIANEFASFARMPKRLLESLDLNHVIQETIHLLQLEEGVQIEVSLSDETLPVQADREELQRIFINLLKNGMQAMPEGGRIEVESKREETAPNHWAFVSVRDNGTGIPPELQDKIFQPNFSTKTSGMGLGLAIVQKSVLDLNGSITFETRMGEGTVFLVRLPLFSTDSPEFDG